MKRTVYFVSIVTLATVVLSACFGNPQPSATAAPVASEPAALTEAPIATESPVVAADATATLRTVDIVGPVMDVGSKYPYVDGTILVGVPSGPFTMGYTSADNPIHTVTLSEFWIYSTKVTNVQYALCVQAGKCSDPDPLNSPTYNNYRYINFPITGVNYDQAASYCDFVHGRLPTEAEWEKTARGPFGNLFPWGKAGPACGLLNYKFCKGKTTHVNDYPKGVSYYSAWDMYGNAREWVADWYSPTYYTEAAAVADPLGPLLGEKRSVRGSSYQDSADATISAHRFSLKPTENLADLGFRCVVEDPTYFAPLCTQLAFIGTGPDGQEADCTPSVKCNDVNIGQGYNCSGKPAYLNYTIVTFTLDDPMPPGWSDTATGCAQLAGYPKVESGVLTDKYQCDLPGQPYTAHVEGSCADTNVCVSTCPANYNKVGDVCQWTGGGTTGTECIAGTTYDPVNQCCSATPGSAVDFGLCSVGYHHVGGACVADAVAPTLETIDEAVGFGPGCAPPPGDDGDNSCDPATDPACQPQSCPIDPASCGNFQFDAGKCCCGYRDTGTGLFVCQPS